MKFPSDSFLPRRRGPRLLVAASLCVFFALALYSCATSVARDKAADASVAASQGRTSQAVTASPGGQPTQPEVSTGAAPPGGQPGDAADGAQVLRPKTEFLMGLPDAGARLAYSDRGGVKPPGNPRPGFDLEPQPLPRPDPIPGGEEYRQLPENPFVRTRSQPLSTFGVDVDTASYANIRRFLAEGRLPLPGAVRIEEIVNYFDYGWREPNEGEPIAVSSESAVCPWNTRHRLVAIGLRSADIKVENLPPSNLVFLIDSSGSMSSADKLPLVKRAFSLLVETLRPQDHVAIVAYAGSAGLVLPPTSGADKACILSAVERLEAGGSTAGGAGIELAYRTALEYFNGRGNNRVILATDGDFNVGLSREADLVDLIESYRNRGVFLSVMGFGTGNIKDAKMEALADKGNGNYSYIDSLSEARKVLVEEAGATLVVAAKDVKLQLEFDPAFVASWRLIGYENRVLEDRDFDDDRRDSGDMGAGHRVTALYEIEPAVAALASGARLGELRLRYKHPDAQQSALMLFPIADQGSTIAAASADLRFAASAALYGMLLRDSAYKGRADWDMVLSLAEGALGPKDERGRHSDRRLEFLELLSKARLLSEGTER